MTSRTAMISSHAKFVLSIFLLSSSFSNANLEVSNSTTTVMRSNVSKPTTTTAPPITYAENSANTGLQGLYSMTIKFLDVVQPPGKNLYDELEVGKALNSTSSDVLSAWGKAFTSRQPQFFLSYFVGFVVCLAFGAVFVVVMPIVGIVLCSCRCCCHTCGHEDTGTPEKPRDKGSRICLGTFLLIFTLLILAGTICAFMSNDLLRRQSSGDDDVKSRDVTDIPLLSSVIKGLAEIDTFKQKTVQESKDLLELTNHTVYKVLDKLFDFPDKATAEINRLIGGDQLRDSFSVINASLVNVIDSLEAIDKNSKILTEQYQSLNESLTQLEANLTQLCRSVSPCTVPTLAFGSDQLLFNISGLLSTLEPFVNISINTSVLDDINISNRIRKDMQPAFDAVNRVNISGIVIGLEASVQSYADKLPSLNPVMKSINETKENVKKYGDYRFYVCVAISAFLLLIVLLNLLALCIGAFTKPPYDRVSSSCPTRWTAGYCLLGSVTLMFAFCFVLMIIVALLFVSGGVVYTEGCRGFRDGSQSNALVKTADALLQTTLQNVSFNGILRDCDQNVGIVKAFNLDQKFNISGRLDLHNLNYLDSVNDFNISSIDVTALTESKSKLNGLKELPDIEEIQRKLNDSTTEMHSRFADGVKELNESARNSTNPGVMMAYFAAAEQLQFLSDSLGANITGETKRIQDSLLKLNQSLYLDNSSKPITEFFRDVAVLIDIATNRTKYDLPELLHQLIGNASSEIKSGVEIIVTEAKTKMMTSVGRCGPVANVVSNIYSSVCYSTLNPYNAFWFSYGWCVFFFIPTIAIAVSLATLYLRSDDIDIGCYDAYKSTEDYYRLQNLATPEHSAGDGHHNNRINSSGGASNYGSNPGYVDDGDNSVSPPHQGNGNPGMNYYRDVGQTGDGSYSDSSYPDRGSDNFHIQRPMVQTQGNGSYDNNNSSRHRF